ncbi:MAG TPA: LCP family protein [Candidatus Saccharimonadales bacterium]|nr:LCP family protein [Candidatus Saccharimonadales bacterium]
MAKKPAAKKASARAIPPRYSSYRPGDNDRRSEPEPEAPIELKPAGWRKIILRTFVILLAATIIFSVVIAAWDARNITSASRKMFGSGSLLELINPRPVKTDSYGRVNVLLVGYSIDDPGHPGSTLTDSIILLSMDGTKHSGFMLSIPRDLYVKIHGFGYGKINEAYKDGGMPLLARIVSQDFDTPIGYYALIDYAAVRQTVDALGGITVDIHSNDPRGLYDPNISKADGGPLKLSNGKHVIDGQTALNLTRARGDPCGCGLYAYGFGQSDFDRTQHQRQVFTAIKDKLNWKLILNPLKNGRILQAASDNIRTDIKADEIRTIFSTFNDIPSSKLESLSLRDLNGINYLASTHYSGDTLTPAAGLGDYSGIIAALNRMKQ